MHHAQIFSLDEARSLIPVLRQDIVAANEELAQQLALVQAANTFYECSEKAMAESAATTDSGALRKARSDFEKSIEQLAKAQESYLERLNFWVEKISSYGVILRDLREGLLDFPAQQGDFPYLLCWRMDDPDVSFWHSTEDGFQGRKPLAVLQEYF